MLQHNAENEVLNDTANSVTRVINEHSLIGDVGRPDAKTTMGGAMRTFEEVAEEIMSTNSSTELPQVLALYREFREVRKPALTYESTRQISKLFSRLEDLIDPEYGQEALDACCFVTACAEPLQCDDTARSTFIAERRRIVGEAKHVLHVFRPEAQLLLNDLIKTAERYLGE